MYKLRAQEVVQHFYGHRLFHIVATGPFHCQAAYGLGKSFLKQAHAAFSGVIVYDMAYGFFRKGNFICRQAMVCKNTGNEMSLCYSHFLFGYVSGDFNNLHAVS